MSRKIIISKYENNTHWSIEVEDSFGQKHHLGYSSNLDKLYVSSEIEDEAMDSWSNEIQNEEDLPTEVKSALEIGNTNPSLMGIRKLFYLPAASWWILVKGGF